MFVTTVVMMTMNVIVTTRDERQPTGCQFVPDIVRHIRIEVTSDSTDVGFSGTNLSLVYCHGQALLTSQYRISCYVELDKLRLCD